MSRDGRTAGADGVEIAVVCSGCEDAVHVPLDAFVDGGETKCPACGTTCDLDRAGDGLVPREVLLDRIPAEAREAAEPVLSEFPSSG